MIIRKHFKSDGKRAYSFKKGRSLFVKQTVFLVKDKSVLFSVRTRVILYTNFMWKDSCNECIKNGRIVFNTNDIRDHLTAKGLTEVWSGFSIQWIRLKGKTGTG